MFLLTVLAVLSCISAPAAGKKVRLSRSSLTINVREAKGLALKGAGKKVKWAVRGRKLVSVSPYGKLRQKAVITAGRRVGSCVVTAKSAGRTYRCRIKITNSGNFREKPLGTGTVDRTGSYIAGKTVRRNADHSFVSAMAGASVRLFQESLSSDERNVLVSPDSVLSAMTIMENGAAGTTLSEMENAFGGISSKSFSQYLATLHRRISKSTLIKYQTANSVWYKKGNIKIKKAFLQKAVSLFDADVFSASFLADTVRDINSWVYNKTFGKISSIIDRLDPSARLAVINAVYFKGAWAEPYSEVNTDTFTRENGETAEVGMLKGTEHTYLTVNGADGFVKYYAGGTLAFLALLPPEGTGVDSFAKTLTGDSLISGYQNRITRNIIVHTMIPEFKYEYELSLNEPLGRMGIKQAFLPAADFSRMTATPVCIDEVLHKTYIELNKKGTEAAAVTAVVAKATSIMPSEEMIIKTVYLNRPFVYAIIDTQTGLPLFIGSVKKI